MADPDLTTRARAMLAGLRDVEGHPNITGKIAINVAATDGPAPVMRSDARQARHLKLIEAHPDRPRIRIGTRWYDGVRSTDLGREVARLLHALDDARAVLAKCPWCIHPRHAGLCTGRNGGTAYQCPCFQDSLHAPEAIEAARLLAEGGAA